MTHFKSLCNNTCFCSARATKNAAYRHLWRSTSVASFVASSPADENRVEVSSSTLFLDSEMMPSAKGQVHPQLCSGLCLPAMHFLTHIDYLSRLLQFNVTWLATLERRSARMYYLASSAMLKAPLALADRVVCGTKYSCLLRR